MFRIISLIFLFSFVSFAHFSHVPPKLSEQSSRRSQESGTKLKLLCSIEKGQRPFTFEWNKNDQQILSNFGDKYRIDSEDDTSVLTVWKLDEKDSANYTCLVRNDYGFDSQTTTLIVKGLIQIKILFCNNMWRLVCH